MIGTNLYTTDSKGKTRFWRIEVEGDKFRAVSGLVDGKAVTAEWTQCFPKNVGRSNATTGEQQAEAEALSLYQKKLDRKYHTEAEFQAGGDEPKGYKFKGPMLAKTYEKFPGPGFSQPKLDGYRSTAEAAAGLLSRQGKPWNQPHIVEALQDVFTRFPGIVLDGELYNHDLKDDFNTLGSLIKRDKRTPDQESRVREVVQYHVYDVLSHPGNFSERWNYLGEVFSLIGPESPVKLVKTDVFQNEDDLDRLEGEYAELGYEGQMVRLDMPYEGNGKRSKSLLKRKDFIDFEAEIDYVEEGKGNWAGHAKAVYFKMPDGRKTKSGENPKAGIKGTKEFTARLLNEWRDYEGVTIRRANDLTPDGIPRFGVAVAWHEDLANRG